MSDDLLHPAVRKINAEAVRQALERMASEIESMKRRESFMANRIKTLEGRVNVLQTAVQESVAGKYGSGRTEPDR